MIKLSKTGEIYKILTFPSPPKSVLDPRFLGQYYLGYFKNIFEKRGYKVQRNYSVYLDINKQVFIGLVAWKSDFSVGIEISEGKYISPNSIDKFKAVNLNYLVFIVKDGKIEDNYEVFLNTNWGDYQNIFFMSIDYLQISSLTEIMTRANTQKKKDDIARSKMKDKYRGVSKQDILTRLQAKKKKDDATRALRKDQYKKTSTRPPRIENKFSRASPVVRSKEKRERSPITEKKVSRARLIERIKQNRARLMKKKIE